MDTNVNSKLISIVVPVYNVESFLEHCITSILEQTYENFEMILVDDGSTDSSGSICDHWAQKDSRIQVIHQQNGGLSAARNSGIDVAKGEYICFIDSDDFITPNYVKDFVDAMEETGADFAMCEMASSKLAESEHPLTEQTVLNSAECRDWLSNPISREYVIMVVACNKMFKREMFKDYRFEHGFIHEDEFMINNFIFDIDNVVYIPNRNYIYRINAESITGKGNSGNLKHLHGIEAYEDRVKKALEHNEKDFAAITFKWALIKLAQYFRDGDAKMQEASKGMYIRIYDNYNKLFSEKQRLKYSLFKMAPKLFCKVFVSF